MKNAENKVRQEAVKKLQEMADEINICLFCTGLKTGDGATTRPMGTQKVDDSGDIWFFSAKDSDKNREIQEDKHVQLFLCASRKKQLYGGKW